MHAATATYQGGDAGDVFHRPVFAFDLDLAVALAARIAFPRAMEVDAVERDLGQTANCLCIENVNRGALNLADQDRRHLAPGEHGREMDAKVRRQREPRRGWAG